MIEALTFIIGALSAYIVVKLKQKWECYQKDMIQKENMNLREEIQKLKAENFMLNDPKRLIKEFQGDEGSGVGELLKTMQKEVNDITKTTEELNKEKNELQTSIAQLERERDTLKNEYDNKLKESYLGAIDELERIVKDAMKGGSLDKNKAVDKLKKKGEELQEKNEENSLFIPRVKK